MQMSTDLKAKQREELLRTLKDRFEKNMNRHDGHEWAKVQATLDAHPDIFRVVNQLFYKSGARICPGVAGGKIFGMPDRARPFPRKGNNKTSIWSDRTQAHFVRPG